MARDYGVSRYWVQQMVKRFEVEGPAAYQPRSRRPHSSPHAVDVDTEDLIIRLRKELSKIGTRRGRGDDRGSGLGPVPRCCLVVVPCRTLV